MPINPLINHKLTLMLLLISELETEVDVLREELKSMKENVVLREELKSMKETVMNLNKEINNLKALGKFS